MSNILLSLLATFVGGGIGFVSAYIMATRNARLTAGGKLRAAFAPELAIMRATPSEAVTPFEKILGPPDKDTDKVLLKAFYDRHAAAVEEYRPFVPAGRQAAYESAWQDYYLWAGSIAFTQYMFGDQGHELYCQRVEALFRFTTTGSVPIAHRLRGLFGRRRLPRP